MSPQEETATHHMTGGGQRALRAKEETRGWVSPAGLDTGNPDRFSSRGTGRPTTLVIGSSSQGAAMHGHIPGPCHFTAAARPLRAADSLVGTPIAYTPIRPFGGLRRGQVAVKHAVKRDLVGVFAQAYAVGFGTYGRKRDTVLMPGFEVSPSLIFQSVVNGTPETADSSLSCACPSARSASRTSSEVGMVTCIAHPTAFGMLGQPNSVWSDASYVTLPGYRIRMSETDSKKTLWANVLRLMRVKYGAENLTKLARDCGIGPGTATRIKAQQTSVGVDVIERIASVFGVQPWQLLTPNLGADLYVIDDERRIVPVIQGRLSTKPAAEDRADKMFPNDAPNPGDRRVVSIPVEFDRRSGMGDRRIPSPLVLPTRSPEDDDRRKWPERKIKAPFAPPPPVPRHELQSRKIAPPPGFPSIKPPAKPDAKRKKQG